MTAGSGARLSFGLGLLAVSNVLLVVSQHLYLVAVLGPGRDTDAFYGALAVPHLAKLVVMGSLAHVLVPLFAGEAEDKTAVDAWTFFSAVSGTFIALALLLGVTTSLWVPLLFPGFDPLGQRLTVDLARIQIASLVFASQTGVLTALHRARRRFAWPATVQMAANGLLLVALFALLTRYGVAAAAWATLASFFVQMLLLAPALGAFRRPDFHSASFAQAWRRLRPLLLGGAYYKSDILVDRLLASMAPAGGLSLLFLATRAYQAVSQIIHDAIAVPLIPALAVDAKRGNWTRYRARFRRRFLGVSGLMLATYLLILFLGRRVLTAVGEFGALSATDLETLWILSIALGGMLWAGASGLVLANAFYAQGDTATPTKVGVFGFSLGIGFKIAGFASHGLVGIAIGTSAYYVLNAVVMIFLIERSLGRRISRA